MGRIITVLTCGLAVASFAYIFSPTYLTVGLCFGITVIFVLLGYLIERKAKVSDGSLLNRVFYLLSRSDKNYNMEVLQGTYSCLGNNTYELKRSVEVKSKKRDLQGIDEHFRWSSPSRTAQILPLEQGQVIKDIHEEDDLTCYHVDFGKVCAKNKKISTGSVVKGLVGTPRPFFSATASRKTKLMVLNVEFANGVQPKGKAVFKIKAGAREVSKSELDYDSSKGRFSKTIYYPRKGWRYIISWEI